MEIRVKRVYEPPAPSDGARVLVDRLWPRGISKERAALDLWMPEIAPSHALRKWFHETRIWEEFRMRYEAELSGKDALLDRLRALADRGSLTLLFSARTVEENHANIIKELLMK